EAPGERQGKAEAAMDHRKRHRLPPDREPAQTNQRLEAEAAAGEVAFGEGPGASLGIAADVAHGKKAILPAEALPGLTGRSKLSLPRCLGPPYSFCNAKDRVGRTR